MTADPTGPRASRDAEPSARPPPRLSRSDAAAMLGLAAGATALEALASVLGAQPGHGATAPLAVYYDGHKYLEIARSFPLPYAPEGDVLLGHAPGYPAAIALAHALCGGLLDWGSVALAVSWLASGLAAAVFYVLCRAFRAPALAASALFAAANPTLVLLGSSAHAEPLALLFATGALAAWATGRVGAAALALTAAVLARFPFLVLLAPLALGVVWARRDTSRRSLLWLLVPALALGLFDLYLHLRVPGFRGIAAAHDFWWRPPWDVPFAGLVRHLGDVPAWYGYRMVQVATTLGYAAIAIWGLARGERERRVLGAWVAVAVAFAASPGDAVGANNVARLALPAWPAALLLLATGLPERWRRPPAAGRAAVAAVCLATAAFGVWYSVQAHRMTIAVQRRHQPFLADSVERLDTDAPVWLDFRALRRERARRGRQPPQ